MKRLAVGIWLLLLSVALPDANASQVVGGPDVAIRIRDEWIALAYPSAGNTIVLVFSFAAAISILALVASQKGIRILGLHFIIPGLLFPVVVWLSIAMQTRFADMLCDFGKSPHDMLAWGRASYLLGSTWYGALISCGIWMFTHPVFFLQAARTKRQTMFSYLPCILAPAILLTWIFLGTCTTIWTT